MKFCLKITSMGYPSYADAINKYPCLGDEKYKMYMTRVWNRDMTCKYDITYIDISSVGKLKELIDETRYEIVIGDPNKLRDANHYELEIYDNYRE